jgi:hypothetical protein
VIVIATMFSIFVFQSPDFRLELLFLGLNKGENDDGKNQIHKKELPHHNHKDAVKSSQKWDINIHKVFQITVPGIRIDNLEDSQQRGTQIIKVSDAIVNIGPLINFVCQNVKIGMLIIVTTIIPIWTSKHT